ncbi:MAG: phosphatase PAP2 family protein [Candidatus Eisenbacteria bacterium]|nr:phosphatase PAP2 family protein [Candidatus Latescibacterota bacterium]MBD3301521.1 phosphatase PAP2 family protein [Candidatus Eisenbacteria bacterium]
MSPDRPEDRPVPRGLLLVGILLLVIALSIAVRATGLDPVVSGWFHQPGESPDWWGKERPFLDLAYEYGVWPANLLGIAGLLGWIFSRFVAPLRRSRRTFAFLFLVWVIGPGILVNMVGKEHIGRPRPRETVLFGGEREFLSIGEPGIPGHGRSFPSGHAAMGAYLAGLALLSRRRAVLWTAVGLAAWGLLGFQRIAVGAHFPTDVLWSGGIVTATAVTVDAALPRAPADGQRLVRPSVLAGIAAVAAILAFLFTPLYQVHEQSFEAPRTGDLWIIEPDLPGLGPGSVPDRPAPEGARLQLELVVRGYGMFSNETDAVWTERPTPAGTIIRVGLERSGFFLWSTSMLASRVETAGP